jgi:1-acyl-sn-glycerol-3-phosphate acyltransferase
MERPDLAALADGRLGSIERRQIALIRKSFEPGRVDDTIRWLQRHVGSTWIHHFTKALRHVHGLDRLPQLDPAQSYICVSNHRSFFDLYVITGDLVRRGLSHRIVFPVRGNFFYDSWTGLFVNGVMSFFAMYPPIFRDKKLMAFNSASLDEVTWLLRRGGTFVGLHPEGTRKKDDDPYTFLPAQPGVGKVIHSARATVLPVFINGLINDLARQVLSNFDGTGREIHVVFGAPMQLDDLYERPASLRTYKAVADRTLAVIGELGQEEKRLRAEGAGGAPLPAARAG